MGLQTSCLQKERCLHAWLQYIHRSRYMAAAAVAAAAERRRSVYNRRVSEAQARLADEEALKPKDTLPLIPGVEALFAPDPPTMVLGSSGQVYGGWSTGRVYHLPRRWAIVVVESHVFETLALCTILANCVTMAADYPIDKEGTPKEELIDKINLVFLGLYTVEMVIKLAAFGVHCGNTGYWHNPWAVFEGAIVFVSWSASHAARTAYPQPRVTCPVTDPRSSPHSSVPRRLRVCSPRVRRTPFLPIPSMPRSLQSILRSFRALRVVRALVIIPGMKALLSSTLHSIPALAATTALWALVIWVMSIAGVQFFKGTLHDRCALPCASERDASPNQRRIHIQQPAHAATCPSIWPCAPRACVRVHRGFAEASRAASAAWEAGELAPYRALFELEEPYDTGRFCHLDPSVCPAGTTCAYFAQNPDQDTTSFDSALRAFFPLVHILMVDSWSAVMYKFMDVRVRAFEAKPTDGHARNDAEWLQAGLPNDDARVLCPHLAH
jgi:hypothetical protein